ncbi:MAG: family transcriptional regulator, cyclic receptor protein [Gaiellaceae bacterium]|nr:family transcriptional regulator, cyclic receptor protein [Gaiellaceae bacterium]
MSKKGASKTDLLKDVPLFEECSKSDLAKIARIADEVDVSEGKELIREGELARQFFILTDGQADVRRNGRKVNTLGPGDFFGEIGLITDRLTSASVKTTTPARALVITRASFKSLMRDAPNIQLKVLNALAHRVAGD